VLDNWYKSDLDKKGVVLMVTTGKEGAVTGGKGFVEVRHAGRGARQQRVGRLAARAAAAPRHAAARAPQRGRRLCPQPASSSVLTHPHPRPLP
jgi:hypothetical protein